jgi:hypothetical protein
LAVAEGLHGLDAAAANVADAQQNLSVTQAEIFGVEINRLLVARRWPCTLQALHERMTPQTAQSCRIELQLEFCLVPLALRSS